jgi:hypothetical protein
MDRIEKKLDGRNGDLAQVKEDLLAMRVEQARVAGAFALAKMGWRVVVWAFGLAVTTGGVGGGVYWVVGRLTGHI